MTKNKSKTVWGFEHLLENALRGTADQKGIVHYDWSELNNWWKFQNDGQPGYREGLSALLDVLRTLVPTVTMRNGIEQRQRHLSSDDKDGEQWSGHASLKGAVKILEWGELEAIVEGDPLPSSIVWPEHRSIIEGHLDHFMFQDEVTEGDDELSRRAHADEAKQLLKSIDFASTHAANQMDSDDERLWLNDVISEIAYLAFEAGQHTRAAWGKEFEKHAASRIRQNAGILKNFGGKAEQESAEWKTHAELVMSRFQKVPATKSECARWILAQWNRVGDDNSRPRPRAENTVLNWLYKQ